MSAPGWAPLALLGEHTSRVERALGGSAVGGVEALLAELARDPSPRIALGVACARVALAQRTGEGADTHAFADLRRDLLAGLPLESEGSFIDAELLVRLRNGGAVIQQVGLDYFPRTRGVSTLSSPRTILRILRDFVRLTPALRAGRRRLAR